jgi:hypothetical protein
MVAAGVAGEHVLVARGRCAVDIAGSERFGAAGESSGEDGGIEEEERVELGAPV